MIPKKRDVVKYCYYVRKNGYAKCKGSSSAHGCCRLVTTEIENICRKFSFPTKLKQSEFSQKYVD